MHIFLGYNTINCFASNDTANFDEINTHVAITNATNNNALTIATAPEEQSKYSYTYYYGCVLCVCMFVQDILLYLILIDTTEYFGYQISKNILDKNSLVLRGILIMKYIFVLNVIISKMITPISLNRAILPFSYINLFLLFYM